MDDESGSAKRARIPTNADLARIARSLNQHGVKYAVIGGFAVIHHGFVRATNDIDLLVDASPENVERLRAALSILEDQAALDLDPNDVAKYNVVRVADEVVVDVIGSAAGVRLAELVSIEYAEIDGVSVPYPSPADLLRTKQTVRDRDALDRQFLEALLRGEMGSL
ncbi:MAG TPA: nucleotidyl transferase AbiEii/AbiGii toxin family protein [Polyangiaceae bacterium]